jgi:hypothetical protein
MSNGLLDVMMSPKEHVYTFELDGECVVFRDRGEYGKVEEGVDILDFNPQSREGGLDESGYVCVNEYARALYGQTIEKRLGDFRASLKRLIPNIVDTIRENPRPVGRMSGAYINLNFNYWCDRESDREPYSQDITAVYKTGTVWIEDNTGDDKADFAKFITDSGTHVEMKSYLAGPLQEMWDHSMKPCNDVDPTRKGLENYLGLFDVLYGRGVNEMLDREL